ncbi:hypothetical protein YC2023_067022 [Brassica napus]
MTKATEPPLDSNGNNGEQGLDVGERGLGSDSGKSVGGGIKVTEVLVERSGIEIEETHAVVDGESSGLVNGVDLPVLSGIREEGEIDEEEEENGTMRNDGFHLQEVGGNKEERGDASESQERELQTSHVSNQKGRGKGSRMQLGLTGVTAAVTVAEICRCEWLRFQAVLKDLYDWYYR